MKHLLPRVSVLEFLQSYGPWDFLVDVVARQALELLPVEKESRINAFEVYQSQLTHSAEQKDPQSMFSLLKRAAERQRKLNAIRFEFRMDLQVEKARGQWFWRGVKIFGFFFAMVYALQVMSH